MANITEEKWIEMLEKKADGTYIAKYPKVKSKSGVTFDEHLADDATAHGGVDANSILTKIKTVDGSGSGLDADLLDGKQASEFLLDVEGAKIVTGSYSGNGTKNRKINIGAKPKLLIVTGVAEDTYRYFRISIGSSVGLTEGNALDNDQDENDNIPFITSTGFTVSSYNITSRGLNGSSGRFNYLAIV